MILKFQENVLAGFFMALFILLKRSF